mmetsp:Transcript_22694/g.33510  ORF Transcript_22694/g.33510 Transcript_22694/m.33510 type:complete len:108 (-) Transcript_22694:100-423(-)
MIIKPTTSKRPTRLSSSRSFTDMKSSSPSVVEDAIIRPGDTVGVRSYFTMKRKGIFHVVDEDLVLGPDNTIVAKGAVTIFAIDSRRGLPTSNVPKDATARIEQHNNS